MSDKVVNMPGKGSLGDRGFQTALKAWRRFAHRRGLIVGSPVRLIGAERTIYGDSDEMVDGAKSYLLNNNGGLGVSVGDLYLGKTDKEMLESVYPELDERSDFDIKDVRAPHDENVEKHEDERGRWEIWLNKNQRVGTVVRVGEGAKKHYLLYLWHGGWYRVTGQPCYDLPMFGLVDLRERPEAPVMIHEGPKAMEGALKAEGGRLANWLSLYVHVSWHGSDIGMEWTDWTPLRGRRVLIWPDMDEAGLSNARQLAKRLSLMGNVVEYVNWSKADIEGSESWDWADPPTPVVDQLTRTSIRSRLVKVESPVGPDGKLLDEFLKRSFVDWTRKEIYMFSRDYDPYPIESLCVGKGKNFRAELMESPINEFRGTDFLPGIPHGRLEDGKINLCLPNKREPVKAYRLNRDIYRELRNGWLARMIPDVQQRKHLLRKAAWAIARPEIVSQHMIVLQGESGIGKSVFLDTLVRVAGDDRAASLFPDSIMSRFNSAIARKSVVCIHEIHSDDLTRKQNASRLKELIANERITIEEKMRPSTSHKNIIHWFAATNERAPFSMEHGNDRFYFVKCASPQNALQRKKLDKFFRKWVPRLKSDVTLDRLYAAAKWLVSRMPKHRQEEIVGRAGRQSVWQYLEKASLRPWEQLLLSLLTEMYDNVEPGGHPPVFIGMDVVRRVARDFPRAGVLDIQARMNEFGFNRVMNKSGGPRQVRLGSGKREVLWCRRADREALAAVEVGMGGWQPLDLP